MISPFSIRIKKSRSFLLLIMFILCSSFVLAETRYSLTNPQNTYELSWGSSVTPTFYIACTNQVFLCRCEASYGNTDWFYVGEFAAGGTSTAFRPFSHTAPSCGKGGDSITLGVRCQDTWTPDWIYASTTVNFRWPSSAQERTYDAANSQISSVSSKIGNTAVIISSAISSINNAQSYGPSCVDVSQAQNKVGTAQSKQSAATSSLNSARNYWTSCNYDTAKNNAETADRTASEAVQNANDAKSSVENAVSQLRDNLDKANSDLTKATSAVQSAQVTLDDAKDLIDKTKSKSACIPVSNIEERITAARQKLETARTSGNSAKSAKDTCKFSELTSYANQAVRDANSASDTAQQAKNEIITLIEEFDQKKGNSEVELNSAKQLMENSRADIDQIEIKIKKSETLACINEVGLADAVALKAEAETSLSSANQEYSLAKTSYDGCDFDASLSKAKNAQSFANQAKVKATTASNKIDSIAEQVQKIKDSIADETNNVKNKIDTAENIDVTIGTLLETHPQETLGKKAFSEAKALREQGREKIKAAKTDFEKASIDLTSGDCSKASNTIKSAATYANDAEETATKAHGYVTQKIQEAGDCANRINNANDETNKLHFKGEYGRIFIIDVLDELLNLTPDNSKLDHIKKLKQEIKNAGVNVLIDLDKAKLNLDEGNFEECLTLAESVRRDAVEIRIKSEEVITEFKTDIQEQSSVLLKYHADENSENEKRILSKQKFVISGKENLLLASEKYKQNAKLLEEIKQETQSVELAGTFNDVMEHSLTLADKTKKIEDNTHAIRFEALSGVNKKFYKGLILVGSSLIIILTGIFLGISKYKKRFSKKKVQKEEETTPIESKPKKKRSEKISSNRKKSKPKSRKKQRGK